MIFLEVVVKRVNQVPKVIDVENEEGTLLEFLEREVGGLIEAVYLANDIIMIVNEEGKLIGLEPNFLIGGDIVAGNAVFLGSEGKKITGLNEEQKIFLLKAFSQKDN